MAGTGHLTAFIGALVLVGATATSSTAGGCPVSDWTAGTVYWAPVVAVDGQIYYPLEQSSAPEEDVGDVVAEVRCAIAGRIHDPGYRFRDGDATYLPVGTQLHQRTTNGDQLLARERGRWQVYVPDTGT